MKIDPVILEGIIRHIVRTDDKDKIMVGEFVFVFSLITMYA